METPLSRQLQQAWLQTQMRKQQPTPPSTDLLSTSQLDSPSSSSSSSNSSSFLASDGSSTSTSSSLPLPDLHITDEHSLRDPALQYISDMLMEEDMEDRKCMAVECTSYQAMAKGFYDILGASDEPDCAPPDLGPQEQQQEQSAEDSEDYRWMDDLLSSEAVNQLRDALEGGARSAQIGPRLSPPWWSDSSSSALSTPEQSSESTSQSSTEGLPWNAVASQVPTVEIPQSTDNTQNMVFPSSSPLNLTFYDNKSNGSQNGGLLQRVVDSGEGVVDFAPVHGFASRKPFRKVVSEKLDVVASKSAASNASRFKRAISERDSGSSGVPWDSGTGETISFVQNKDLNAELLGHMLHGGSICPAKPCSKSLSLQREGGGGVAEKGIRKPGTTVDLTGLLMSCAQAVAADDLPQANHILQQIRREATPYGDGGQRLAHYFAEGLVARLSGTGARLYSAFTNNVPSSAQMLRANHTFGEVSPFFNISHYFANKAILDAAEGASRLHIVDYGILYGLQWPSLITALTGRVGGPPLLRITGIEVPQPGYKSAERVEMTGRRLSEYAKTYGVPFEYRAIASKWENVQTSSLHLRQDEVLVVNSMFRLRHLLDETVVASNPRKTVLGRIRSMNPKVFVMGIKNGSYNSPFFMSRFREALKCASYKFDMIDTLIPRDNQDRLMLEREVMGRDIINVISCEGPERVERPETYKQWQNRTQRAGFEQMPLDANVVKTARDIVNCSYHKHFGLDEDGEWMLMSWKGHIVHGLTLWKSSSK